LKIYYKDELNLTKFEHKLKTSLVAAVEPAVIQLLLALVAGANKTSDGAFATTSSGAAAGVCVVAVA
jgi:hypothetical protein